MADAVLFATLLLCVWTVSAAETDLNAPRNKKYSIRRPEVDLSGVAQKKFRGQRLEVSAEVGESSLTSLEDVMLTVKTGHMYHRDRVGLLLNTWLSSPTVRNQTYVVTDKDDAYLRQAFGNDHFIVTNCSEGHKREALSCKMGWELATYLKHIKQYRWFCHVDDDNYVRVSELSRRLRLYPHWRRWYLGKASTSKPVALPIGAAPNNEAAPSDETAPQLPTKFWFATGGAGLCLSRGLLESVAPVIRSGGAGFSRISGAISLPDDVTLGYIVEHLLGHHLTTLHGLHSHLEPLSVINADNLRKQLTLSYDLSTKNVVDTSGIPEVENDPTQFLTVHKYLESLHG